MAANCSGSIRAFIQYWEEVRESYSKHWGWRLAEIQGEVADEPRYADHVSQEPSRIESQKTKSSHDAPCVAEPGRRTRCCVIHIAVSSLPSQERQTKDSL